MPLVFPPWQQIVQKMLLQLSVLIGAESKISLYFVVFVFVFFFKQDLSVRDTSVLWVHVLPVVNKPA